MCRPGNQTIYRACRDLILRQTGKATISNREAREVLAQHGGCLYGRRDATTVSFGTLFRAILTVSRLHMAIDGKTGRPQSIPQWAWPEVFWLHKQGLGYRRVAASLASLKVWTTKSSVERLIKGLPPYQGRRPSVEPPRLAVLHTSLISGRDQFPGTS